MQLAMCVFRHATSLEPKSNRTSEVTMCRYTFKQSVSLQGGTIITRPLGLSKYWRPKLRSAQTNLLKTEDSQKGFFKGPANELDQVRK